MCQLSCMCSTHSLCSHSGTLSWASPIISMWCDLCSAAAVLSCSTADACSKSIDCHMRKHSLSLLFKTQEWKCRKNMNIWRMYIIIMYIIITIWNDNVIFTLSSLHITFLSYCVLDQTQYPCFKIKQALICWIYFRPFTYWIHLLPGK